MSELTITDRSDIAAGDFDIAFSGESDEQRGGTWNCGDPPTDDSCHNDPPTSTTYQPEGSYVAECTTTTQMDETNHYFGISTNSSGGTDYSYAFTDTDAWNDATEARVTVVGLTAYRTGDNYGTAVSAGDQQSGDPSNYVILTNNGYTEAEGASGDPQGLLDDMDYNEQLIAQQGGIGSAAAANVSLAEITLKQAPQAVDSDGNTVAGGYVTIGLSNASAVRIYDDQGNVLWDPTSGNDDGSCLTADLSGSSYLAGLANGDVTIYVEGLSADSDFSLTYNYSAPSGSITPAASTSIHMAIGDVELVDYAGNILSGFDGGMTDSDIAGLSGQDSAAKYSDSQELQSVEFQVRVQGLDESEIQGLTISSGSTSYNLDLTDADSWVGGSQYFVLDSSDNGTSTDSASGSVVLTLDTSASVTIDVTSPKDKSQKSVQQPQGMIIFCDGYMNSADGLHYNNAWQEIKAYAKEIGYDPVEIPYQSFLRSFASTTAADEAGLALYKAIMRSNGPVLIMAHSSGAQDLDYALIALENYDIDHPNAPKYVAQLDIFAGTYPRTDSAFKMAVAATVNETDIYYGQAPPTLTDPFGFFYPNCDWLANYGATHWPGGVWGQYVSPTGNGVYPGGNVNTLGQAPQTGNNWTATGTVAGHFYQIRDGSLTGGVCTIDGQPVTNHFSYFATWPDAFYYPVNTGNPKAPVYQLRVDDDITWLLDYFDQNGRRT